MVRNPETQVLVEQALRHVLSEQKKLLSRSDCGELAEVLLSLNNLATNTNAALAAGIHRITSTKHLTEEARMIEQRIDAISAQLWSPILISISAIFERIEDTLEPAAGKKGFVSNTRTHFHNLRLRLLEQTIGARMLAQNSDLGDEIERIWQQFLERELGRDFRVLRGGHIFDHEGNRSQHQIDLIVVPSDAMVTIPGDSEGGKAQVLIDDVISAIMVTSNLTVQKLRDDWSKLQKLPAFEHLEKDHPALKSHPWPLCYILGAQSDSSEDLEHAWKKLCEEGHLSNVPQFVISLDGGFLYSGATKWPRPRYPGNYITPAQVSSVTGIFAGLGLGWLITQHRGRLAAIKRQQLGSVSRVAVLLEDASLRSGLPPTYSRRFDVRNHGVKIAGILTWGWSSHFAHNQLELTSLRVEMAGATTRGEFKKSNATQASSSRPNTSFDEHFNNLRWFNSKRTWLAGNLFAVEEWENTKSREEHSKHITVFNILSGDEIQSPEMRQLDEATAIATALARRSTQDSSEKAEPKQLK